MKAKENKIIDQVVSDLRRMEATLSGDDSALMSVWDEIKEQVQNEESFYWDTYVETMRDFISCAIMDAKEAGNFVLPPYCEEDDPDDEIEEAYLQLLLSRAESEPIECRPFDYQYFCYRLLDFTAYGMVLKRTGLSTCLAKVFSVAAPSGETGTVEVSRIDCLLTEDEFKAAEKQRWPETWDCD